MTSVREIDSKSDHEIELVAKRMRMTLEDVLGKKRGESMYSMDWLLERVRWHLSLGDHAKIFLAENEDSSICGQAVVRIEKSKDQNDFGFFSTLYVEPASRKKGVASRLVSEVEKWCLSKHLSEVTYNTAENNTKLIDLFEKLGYKIIDRESDMIKFQKNLKS